ncbi:MAG: hypothetical protein Fur003_5040 [Candidatus Dojkabacteria bacterium]
MKTVQNISSTLIALSLGIYGATMVFSGSLTVLGYLIFVPMLVGATGSLACLITNAWPEKKAVPANEKEGVKPQTATA